MLILETHASSEKEALEKSAKILEVDSQLIEVIISRKGSSGFLGFGTKKPSLFQILAKKDITPMEAVVKGVLYTIINKMGYHVKVNSIELKEDEKTYVELSSAQAGHIIGRQGRTLESLQFMVNLLVQNFLGAPPRILLDIENYRKRRAKDLTKLAENTANFVARSGKSRLLNPLNPYERRLVHMALQEHPTVATNSEGHGVYKRVRVFLKEKQRTENFGNEAYEDDVEEIDGNVADNYANDNDL